MQGLFFVRKLFRKISILSARCQSSVDILRFVLAFRPKCQFDVDNSFEKNDNSSEIIVCVGRKNLTIVP